MWPFLCCFQYKKEHGLLKKQKGFFNLFTIGVYTTTTSLLKPLQRQLRPVHTNPFSNENGAVLLGIRLSSTLQRRKRSPETESFENAIQSGAIWKRCFLKTLFSSVDGENDAIWKRWRHPNRHDRAPTKNREWHQSRSQSFVPLDQRSENGSSGSIHFRHAP